MRYIKISCENEIMHGITSAKDNYPLFYFNNHLRYIQNQLVSSAFINVLFFTYGNSDTFLQTKPRKQSEKTLYL